MICSKCSIEKSINDFQIRNDTDKRRKVCNDCREKYRDKYYQKNKNILYQKHKEYKIKNKEKIKQYLKEYQKKYYSNPENRKKRNKYQRERRNQHRKDISICFWTEEEINFLKENENKKTYDELANELCRSQCSIEQKMRRLKIKPKMKQRKWINNEIDYIKQNAKNKTYKELANDLNRRYEYVVQKMNELNIIPKRRETLKWTKDEIKHLKKNTKDKTYEEIAKDLNRSKRSVERKMCRLNLKPSVLWERPEWDKNKIKYLQENAKKKTYFEIAFELNKPAGSIGRKMCKLNLKPKQHEKYKTVNHKFFKTWSEEMSYIFGYWFADGNINSNGKKKYNSNFGFSISSKDLEILKKIKEIMNSTYIITKSKKIVKNKIFYTYIFKIYGKEIYNDIVKLGGCERKSLIAKFPQVPNKYVRHFIRGYFDGDGCLSINYKNRNYPKIDFLGTKDFLSKLIEYLSHQTNIRKYHNIYSINYNGKKAQDILEYMYKDSNIYLERKYKRYKDGMQWKKKNNKWTDKEIDILKQKFPKNRYNIPVLLKRHSYGSIYMTAKKLELT